MTAAKFDVVKTGLAPYGDNRKVYQCTWPGTTDSMQLSLVPVNERRENPAQYWLRVEDSNYEFNADDLRALASKLDELNGVTPAKTFTQEQVYKVIDDCPLEYGGDCAFITKEGLKQEFEQTGASNG